MVAALSIATNGAKQTYPSKGNYETALYVARMFQNWRDKAKFRELSLDEKYEYLTSQTDKREIDKVFSSLTEAELKEITHRLGIDPKDSHAVNNTQLKLRGIADVNMVKTLADAGDTAGLRDALDHKVRPYGLRLLCAEIGIDAGKDLDVDSTLVREKLIEHYVLKTESSVDVVEVSEAVSNAIKVIKTSSSYSERHDALMRCTDAEMLEVMRAYTGEKAKLGSDYEDDKAERAWEVLFYILEARGEVIVDGWVPIEGGEVDEAV